MDSWDDDIYAPHLGASPFLDVETGFVDSAYRVRHLSDTEKLVAKQVNRAKVADMIKKKGKKPKYVKFWKVPKPIQLPKATYPEAVREDIKKWAYRNPVKYAELQSKAQASKISRQWKTKVKKKRNELRKQMMIDLQKLTKEMKEAVKTGAVSSKMANELFKQKRKELQNNMKLQLQAIKKSSQQEMKADKVKSLEVYNKVVRARGNYIDAKAREAESEKRRIQGLVQKGEMDPKVANPIIKSLDQRINNLQLGKKQLQQKAIGNKVTFLAKHKILPEDRARELSDKIKRGAKKVAAEKIITSPKMQKEKSDLYSGIKWEQAYEAAISHAENVGASWVIIPLKKENETITEIKMPLKVAKTRLARLKMGNKLHEGRITKMKGKEKVPSGVIAVSQYGQRIGPEAITAQINYIKQQSEKGKINKSVANKAIMHLMKAKQMLYVKGPKRRVMVVPVCREALKRGAPAGEKVAVSKPGVPITKKKAIPATVPTAIPHKTYVKTEVKTVKPKAKIAKKVAKKVPVAKKAAVPVPAVEEDMFESLVSAFTDMFKGFDLFGKEEAPATVVKKTTVVKVPKKVAVAKKKAKKVKKKAAPVKGPNKLVPDEAKKTESGGFDFFPEDFLKVNLFGVLPTDPDELPDAYVPQDSNFYNVQAERGYDEIV